MQVHLEGTSPQHQLGGTLEERDRQSRRIPLGKGTVEQFAIHRPKCFPFDADNNKLRVDSLRFLARAAWHQLHTMTVGTSQNNLGFNQLSREETTALLLSEWQSLGLLELCKECLIQTATRSPMARRNCSACGSKTSEKKSRSNFPSLTTDALSYSLFTLAK